MYWTIIKDDSLRIHIQNLNSFLGGIWRHQKWLKCVTSSRLGIKSFIIPSSRYCEKFIGILLKTTHSG